MIPEPHAHLVGPRRAADDERGRLTYTVPEVAQLLGISRGSAYAAVRNGELPALRVGHRRVIPRAALEQMMRAAVPELAPTTSA